MSHFAIRSWSNLHRILVLVGLLVGLGIAGTGLIYTLRLDSQKTPQTAQPLVVQGVITSIDVPHQQVVVTQTTDGKAVPFTISLDKGTTISQRPWDNKTPAKTLTLHDLTVGQFISVRGSSRHEGTLVASIITADQVMQSEFPTITTVPK